ncbi:unnamed protein product [Oncorhynchus mykiss]|uniref:Uncharacterized protein n=1 Tax=Oncorhynchus mykiss TaxID=8022 RepID=A0A060Y395_ONCMY|nr:unnamed protein product [Oncorhynchus mykiss]
MFLCVCPQLEQTQRELSRLQQVNISLQQQLQQERERTRENHLLQFSSAQSCAWQRLQKLNQDLRFELEAQRRSQEEAREAELQRRAEFIALQARALSAGEAAALARSELQQERQSARKQREEGEHEHRQELECLRQRLQEVSAQMRAKEEAQAEKEVRLQKHLGLLQESQDRERRSLGANLAQAERRTQDLQEQLQKAEQQAETLLQGEGEQLERRCQELQNQLAEADGEVVQLQRRLQTEETDYYNLEHSYESVSEELQRALGQAQEREVAASDAREDYKRLLDRKERELSEALVKMAALGSSLEETELKLNGGQTNGSSVPAISHYGPGSCSVDPAYQYIVTAGDDPDRFMSVIQVLETKLYVTEEKLRDITQRLEEPQGQWCSSAATDPHVLSQLTQSRAATQRLSLFLHNQAKQSRRFALETEGRTRVEQMSKGTYAPMSCPEGEEAGMETLGRALELEASTLEKMASAMQSQDTLFCQNEALLGGDEGDSAHMYADVLLKRMALGMDCREPVGGDTESEESAIGRVCARAELAYISLTLQHRYQGEPIQEELHSDNPTREQLSGQARGLADVSPPELAPYEEQVQLKLAVQLRKRAKVLHQLCQEIPSSSGSKGESSAAKGRRWLDDPDSVGTLDLTLYWPEVLVQSQVTYVACRLQLDHEQELQQCKGAFDSLGALCQEQEAMLSRDRRTFSHALSRLQEDSQALKEKLEQVEQGRAAAESETRRKVGEQVQKLEEEFQGKMQELQKIHEEEMIRLHSHHAQSAYKLNLDGACKLDMVSIETMKKRIHVLETQVNTMKDEAGRRNLEGDECEIHTLQVSCERGFTAMEEVHQKLVGDLQRQHQREVATLLQERDCLLEEETAATVAAIEAIRNAHREELERSQSGGSSDITDLPSQYEVELRSLHRELEVLSGQYSQKCLECAQQNQALEAERQALLQCQRENQVLIIHKQARHHQTPI